MLFAQVSIQSCFRVSDIIIKSSNNVMIKRHTVSYIMNKNKNDLSIENTFFS